MNEENNGENDVEKTEKRPKGFLWELHGCVTIFVILLIVTLLSIGSLFWNMKNLSVIAMGMRVEAELIRTVENHRGGGPSGSGVGYSTYYSNIYQFISDDGTLYESFTISEFKNKSDADARIGQKIYIYIDGKGYCVEDTGKDIRNRNIAIIVSSIFLPITTAFGIIFLIPHRWKNPYSYPKKKKKNK